MFKYPFRTCFNCGKVTDEWVAIDVGFYLCFDCDEKQYGEERSVECLIMENGEIENLD